MAYSNHGMLPQAFGLPRPIITYMIENPRGFPLRKLYNCCKYFYHRRSYCIVDEVKILNSYDNIRFIIDSKIHEVRQLNALNNIWVTQKVIFLNERMTHFLMSKNIRWDAKEVYIGRGTEILKSEFDILTKSGTVKKWESRSSIRYHIYRIDDFRVPIEDLLANLLNAKDITQVFDSRPKH